jgi:hypothetical protein
VIVACGEDAAHSYPAVLFGWDVSVVAVAILA